MAGSRRDVDGMGDGNAARNGGGAVGMGRQDVAGSGKRRLSRSRRAGFVVVDGGETEAESSARPHAVSSASSSKRAAVTSDAGRIVVPPIDTQPSGHAKRKPMASRASSSGREARRDGVERGAGESVSHAGGRHGSTGGSRGNAQKAVPLGNGNGTRSHAQSSAAGGMRRGIPGSVTGVRADGGNRDGDVPSPAHKGGARAKDSAVSEASRRSDSVTGGGAYAGRGVGNTGVSGHVSGSQGVSGSVIRGVRSADTEIGRRDTVSSPSDGGRPVGNGSSADNGQDGSVSTGVGFTEEERRLYDEAHAPLADRIRRAFAESWVPIACVIVIGIAIALRFLMAFSSVVLTVLAIGVGVILMGSIIYITYEDQRKANALADEAEMLYAEKCRIEERAARRNDDAAAGSDDGKGNRKAES